MSAPRMSAPRGERFRRAAVIVLAFVPALAVAVVAAADPFTTAENQATEQAAQIQNMILEGYDAIVLNAASPSADFHVFAPCSVCGWPAK